jgi:hypothetical protein
VGSADRHWAYHTPSLNGLSYRFAVRSDDERLGSYAETLLAGLRGEGPIEHWYSLTRSAGASAGSSASAGSGVFMVDVDIDGEPGVQARRPGDALAWVVWHANQAAADAGRDHLLFHAGGVCATNGSGSGLGVLMPAGSGSGKSTLTAGLVRAGLSYLSDELIALEWEPESTATGGRLLPYAKPITVKPGSFDALRDMEPRGVGGAMGAGDGMSADEWWDGEEWLLPVGEEVGRPVAAPCVPGLVVVPRYRAGATTELTPLSETEAFVALAVNAVNFKQHGANGASALGDLVSRCACVALTMSDLREACALVLDAVARASARRTRQGAGRAR